MHTPIELYSLLLCKAKTQYLLTLQVIRYYVLALRAAKAYILWNSMTSTSFVFTELANTMKYGGGGEGSYITLFSQSDVTAFHRRKYGGGGVI